MNNFLTAQWKNLIMANYIVDESVLEKYLPYNTELDYYNNKCYVSLVGFMFLDVKILGIKVPLHTNFEEVNLRFYVKHNDNGVWKRGVVFIKEIVPKHAITLVANTIYNEHYQTLPMKHYWEMTDEKIKIEYSWKYADKWNFLKIESDAKPMDISEGSEEEFITEHYWGYTKIKKEKTSEYGVEHPRWKIYNTSSYAIDLDYGQMYGDDFEFLNSEKPASVFLAEGSDIAVKGGKILLK